MTIRDVTHKLLKKCVVKELERTLIVPTFARPTMSNPAPFVRLAKDPNEPEIMPQYVVQGLKRPIVIIEAEEENPDDL